MAPLIFWLRITVKLKGIESRLHSICASFPIIRCLLTTQRDVQIRDVPHYVNSIHPEPAYSTRQRQA